MCWFHIGSIMFTLTLLYFFGTFTIFGRYAESIWMVYRPIDFYEVNNELSTSSRSSQQLTLFREAPKWSGHKPNCWSKRITERYSCDPYTNRSLERIFDSCNWYQLVGSILKSLSCDSWGLYKCTLLCCARDFGGYSEAWIVMPFEWPHVLLRRFQTNPRSWK